MLTIRLQRIGCKNRAAFRVVATESTTGPKSAKHVEVLGSYDPHNNSATLKKERITHWLSNGAQASDTVHNMLVTQGVVPGPKRVVHTHKVEAITEQPVVATVESQPEETKGGVASE